MARCQICLKSGRSGFNVSHSKRHTRTRWLANIQKATIYTDGVAKKVFICTRCIRSRYKGVLKA